MGKRRSLRDQAGNLWFSVVTVFRSNPSNMTATLVVQIITSLSFFLSLFLVRQIINSLSAVLQQQLPTNQALYTVGVWILLSSALSLSLVFLGYFREVLYQKQDIHFNQHIDYVMATKSVAVDISLFDSPSLYQVIADAQQGRQRLAFVIYRVFGLMSNGLSLVFAITIGVASAGWSFTGLVIILTVPALLTRGQYLTRQFVYEERNRNLSRKIGYVAGVILGRKTAKEVRFYGMADRMTRKYMELWESYIQPLKMLIRRTSALDSALSVLPVCGIMIAQYVVLRRIMAGETEIGDFVYVLGVLTSLYNSMLSVVDEIGRLGESDYAIRKYNSYIALPTAFRPGSRCLGPFFLIEFRNVDFVYPGTDQKVLDNISFTIDTHRRTAIVGANGAGKTTIIKLLLRYYDPSSGHILIDDVDIRDYTLESVRRAFSVVFQDFVIYAFSIRDNVAMSDYANREDDKSIVDSLRLAQLDQGILDRATSLDTLVGREFSDEGIELSGGQRQKLAIARSAFRNAPVIIMDEPTASLDPEAEKAILLQLEELHSNRGLVMVSHRLSNTTMMDTILVVEKGGVIETGSHHDLMREGGRYSYLFGLQATKYGANSGHSE